MYLLQLIDAELIRTGPPSFDLAMFISHLQYFYHVHRIYPKPEVPDFASTLQDMISAAGNLLCDLRTIVTDVSHAPYRFSSNAT